MSFETQTRSSGNGNEGGLIFLVIIIVIIVVIIWAIVHFIGWIGFAISIVSITILTMIYNMFTGSEKSQHDMYIMQQPSGPPQQLNGGKKHRKKRK